MALSNIDEDLEKELACAAGKIADAAQQLCGGDLRKAASSTINSVTLYNFSAGISMATDETQKSARAALEKVLALSAVSTGPSQLFDVTKLKP
jgi:hypothetical protein